MEKSTVKKQNLNKDLKGNAGVLTLLDNLGFYGYMW